MGSVLAPHTDGLLPPGYAGFGASEQRLRRALARAESSLDDLRRTVVDALVAVRPYDDVALLMLRTRCLGAEHVVSWDLPTDPAVVAAMRQEATRQLAAWGLQELAFTTELVVSELVTNAIRHAAGLSGCA